MNITQFSLNKPYTILAVFLLVVALGLFSFFQTPTDLFPDTAPPQVAIITVWRGATAQDVADKITQIIEKEANTLGGVKNITSTSRDEVSSVSVEFLYERSIGQAILDVQNAVARIQSSLPGAIQAPRIYPITDATKALLTVALSPTEDSRKSLSEIRLLAENQIQDAILSLPGVADVDVFGGHKPEINIQLRRDRLAAHQLSITEVISVLAKENVSSPAGMIYTGKNEYLIRVNGEFLSLNTIRSLPIRKQEKGYLLLSDVGQVELGEEQPHSVYHGNGQPAIALNILRSDQGATKAAIQSFKDHLPELKARYPDIAFEITDDQEPIIDINVQGMRQSLIQATLLTVFVIFLFLADLRAALIVSVSIPLSFFGSLMVLWFTGYTMNMVTLSGLIISVGMVVDSSIVVLENIYRHHHQNTEAGAIANAHSGAKEVAFSITAGMLTTILVVLPAMFTGGYTQRIMRPLNIMISSTLLFSLLVSLLIIPLFASRLLAIQRTKRTFLERWAGFVDKGIRSITQFYLYLLAHALRWRAVTIVVAIAFFALTIKLALPLVGAELMPPMDVGISIVEFDTPSDYQAQQVERVLNRVEKMVQKQPSVKMMSSVVGSEPGEISFGAGSTTSQTGKITVNLSDRLHRDKSIWAIQDEWRNQLRTIPGVRTFRVNEYGATPLSTTKAPLDIIIRGSNNRVIDQLANQVLDSLKGVRGIMDVRRSWYFDKTIHELHVDSSLARLYDTSPAEIGEQLQAAIQGVQASKMSLDEFLDIPIRVQYAEQDIQYPNQLPEAYIPTHFGILPLRTMVSFTRQKDQPFITRENLQNSIDITAVNHTYTIAQVAKEVQQRIEEIHVPRGYRIEVSGSFSDMQEGRAAMGKALLLGLVLLYFLLVSLFQSFTHPLTIMAAIPLTVAGAIWGLLLFNKPMCNPAMMGMILVGGTIVNNSILLLDFILKARQSGMSKDQAILKAVKLRNRPILMTTTSTIIGLTPLIFELAVGLERMSPLGIVAASGLLLGTFLTMIIVPVVYSLFDSVLNVRCLHNSS